MALLSFIVLTLFLSLAVVSASDNVTSDVISDDAPEDSADEILKESVDESDEIQQEPLSEVDNEILSDTKDGGAVSSVETPAVSPSNTATTLKSSELSSSNQVSYTKFTKELTVKLTSKSKPLANKKVILELNGRTFKKTTDNNGKVTLKYNIAKVGTYNLKFSFGGDDTYAPSSGSSKITVKKAIKTKLKIGDPYLNYRQGSKCLFYVKLINEKGKAISGQTVKFKVNGKTYKAKTTKSGNAKIYLSLKKGTYKVKYSFAHKCPYFSSTGSHKILVRDPMGKGNGYWLWPMHMSSVNLKSLAARGTKHILLHSYAITSHGKSAVESFIKKAHGYGIKVHLWVQICYDGENWISPVNKDKDLTIKFWFINQKVRESVNFAKVKGVDGIHFDYVRFGGTAHNYKASAAKALNWFVKKASYQVHKVRPQCILSAAVMPEPDMMMYYYGQDIPTMSKYLDVILPMVYKGNYGQDRAWIKSVTKTFAKQSKGAQIWTGLQSYRSDNDVSKLSQSELIKDSKAAKAGGAKGVVLFRVGISHNFYFNKVF